MRIAIVIPAYNEARTIRDLVQRALKQSTNVIVVDDGSTDATADVLSDCSAIVLRHERNNGKGAALCTGFARALALGVDAVVTMDGDGQHRPEDVARLALAAAANPHRLIIAARLRYRQRTPRLRYWGNRLADVTLGWAAGHAFVDSQSGQRLYPAALLAQLSSAPCEKAGFAFETDVLIRAAQLGYSCVVVPIEAVYDDAARPSHFRPLLDLWRISSVVMGHLVASHFSPRALYRSVCSRPHIFDTEERVSPGDVTGAAPAPPQSHH